MLMVWAWWRLFYAITPRPRSFDKFLTATIRTCWPWFKPGVWHDADGKKWEITLKQDSDYVAPLLLPVDARISQYTGEIVGFTIRDRVLAEQAKQDWASVRERGAAHVQLDT